MEPSILTKTTRILAAAASLAATSASEAALISLDFDEAGTVNTQSGDVNAGNGINIAGQIFSGQTGAWNSLAFANSFPTAQNATPSITDMTDGDGNATTVGFSYNTGGAAFTYRQIMYPFDGTGQPLRSDHFSLDDGTWAAGTPPTSTSIAWEITGLTPGGFYDLILFGQTQAGPGPVNESTFTIFGNTLTNDAEFDGNATGIVANAAGMITGTHEAQGWFDAWNGLQIQDSAIPEPSTSALFGLGFLGLILRRSR